MSVLILEVWARLGNIARGFAYGGKVSVVGIPQQKQLAALIFSTISTQSSLQFRTSALIHLNFGREASLPMVLYRPRL